MTTPSPPVVDNLPDDPQKVDGAKLFNQKASVWTAALDAFTGQVNSLAAWMQLYFGSIVEGKQDTLESGTNIKTINGDSLLGSGDLTVSGDGGFDNSLGFLLTQWSIDNGSPFTGKIMRQTVNGFTYFNIRITALYGNEGFENYSLGSALPYGADTTVGYIFVIFDINGDKAGYIRSNPDDTDGVFRLTLLTDAVFTDDTHSCTNSFVYGEILPD